MSSPDNVAGGTGEGGLAGGLWLDALPEATPLGDPDDPESGQGDVCGLDE